jgi:hypothetical protein
MTEAAEAGGVQAGLDGKTIPGLISVSSPMSRNGSS